MRPLPKGNPVNPKLVKMIVKLAVGSIFSAAMAYTYRLEKKAEEQIDDYFESKETAQED
jgi:hypothetical protein